MTDQIFLNTIGGVDLNSLSKVFNVDEPDNSVTLINHYNNFDHDSAIKLLKEHTNNFIIFSTNIASIRSKFDELTIFIDELKQNNVKFGAICLQETWLADDENNSLLQFTWIYLYFSR